MAQSHSPPQLDPVKMAPNTRARSKFVVQEADELLPLPLRQPATVKEAQSLIDAIHQRGHLRPTSADAAADLIKSTHEFGHFGSRAVHARLTAEGYAWPGMAAQIKKTCADCQRCQQWNASKRIFHPLRTHDASFPWDAIQVDLVTSLETDDFGFSNLLVVTDVFTSFTILRPLKDKTAETVAAALWQLFGDLGPPRLIQSDGGREFVNRIITSMVQVHGTEHRTIPAYNPRANGIVEKHGHIASMTVRKLADGIRPWSTVLPMAQLAMNTKIKNTSNAAPFALFFNRAVNNFPSFLSDTFESPTTADHQQWLDRELKLHQLIFPTVRFRQQQLKRRANSAFHPKQLTDVPLPNGAIVWLKDPLLPRNKDSTPFDGPYTIIQRLPDSTYELRDAAGGKLQRKVTRDMIKLHSTASLKASQLQSSSSDAAAPAASSSSSPASSAASHQPGPVIPSSSDSSLGSYQVDAILDHRHSTDASGKPCIEYKVKWHGWSENQATWEPDVNIDDLDLIRDYTNKRRIITRKGSNSSSSSTSTSSQLPSLSKAHPLPSRLLHNRQGIATSIVQLRRKKGSINPSPGPLQRIRQAGNQKCRLYRRSGLFITHEDQLTKHIQRATQTSERAKRASRRSQLSSSSSSSSFLLLTTERRSQTFLVNTVDRRGGDKRSISVSTRTASTISARLPEVPLRTNSSRLIPVRFWMIQACKQLRATDAK